MPKLLLIQPSMYAPDGSLCTQSRLYLPGLALPLLAAMAPRHWTVEVRIEVVDKIEFDTDADLVGIGTMGQSTFRGIDLARLFREQGKPVVMGGYMASIMAEEILKHVDSVVVGDAERSFPKMLDDFETNGRLERIYDIPVSSLEGLPLPRYDLLLEKKIGGMLPVQAGRGCPHQCSFCSIACLYKGRYLFRPVHEVVRDIRAVRECGMRRFYLIDDNIVSNPRYLEELCDAIRPLKMQWATQCSLELARHPGLLKKVRDAGATMMSFGIESLSQEGLDKLNKQWLRVERHERAIEAISRAGIAVSSEMMLGTDGDTEESIRATFDFVNRVRIPVPRFYILTPMPGTALYDQYKREGRLLTEDYTQYTASRCVHQPARMSASQLDELYWWLYKKVFGIGCILRRTLLHPSFFRQPAVFLFALFVNLHYRRYIKRGIPPNIL